MQAIDSADRFPLVAWVFSHGKEQAPVQQLVLMLHIAQLPPYNYLRTNQIDCSGRESELVGSKSEYPESLQCPDMPRQKRETINLAYFLL